MLLVLSGLVLHAHLFVFRSESRFALAFAWQAFEREGRFDVALFDIFEIAARHEMILIGHELVHGLHFFFRHFAVHHLMVAALGMMLAHHRHLAGFY